MAKRVFLIVLDSFGIGGAPDEAAFDDEGSNTLAAVCSDSDAPFDNLARMGLFDIDGLTDPRILKWRSAQNSVPAPIGSYGRVRELSSGKDSTIGHWEIAGVYSSRPQPTYPDGFPPEVIDGLKQITGRDILCNKPYSGTQVIADYGEEHMKTGALIVYTSADSVLQIAAHEDIVPVPTLYEYCAAARELMTGEHAVGRIIARPFVGEPGNFVRTSNRHDYALTAPSSTMLDMIAGQGLDVISVGKIKDLYAMSGITEAIPTSGNTEGISVILDLMSRDFHGLCMANLVDFDMKYGHRNNIEGYAAAMHEWDDALGTILSSLRPDDLLIITADHGCDPSTPSTDHSRECIPLLLYGEGHNVPHNLGELTGFGNIAHIIYNSLLSRSYPGKGVGAAGMSAVPTPSSSAVPTLDNIMSFVDLTNLKVTATEQDIAALIDKAVACGCASVCIPPSHVRYGASYSAGRIPICTVIGFPNGYSTTAVKVFEAIDAIDGGASEIDMVINIGDVKSGAFDRVSAEIRAIASAVHSRGALLKVIIETCCLTDDEKRTLCHIVTDCGADFIKTSTGFGSAGATVEDVALMASSVGEGIKIKAAGGIRSPEAARSMIDAGASRIGASGL